MKFKERKKYILRVLEYLKYNDKNKKLALRHNYGIMGRITKKYVNFEKEVHNAFIKVNLVERSKKQKELEGIVNEFILKVIEKPFGRREQENLN